MTYLGSGLRESYNFGGQNGTERGQRSTHDRAVSSSSTEQRERVQFSSVQFKSSEQQFKS
jgi:hypothetical protein